MRTVLAALNQWTMLLLMRIRVMPNAATARSAIPAMPTAALRATAKRPNAARTGREVAECGTARAAPARRRFSLLSDSNAGIRVKLRMRIPSVPMATKIPNMRIAGKVLLASAAKPAAAVRSEKITGLPTTSMLWRIASRFAAPPRSRKPSSLKMWIESVAIAIKKTGIIALMRWTVRPRAM